MHVADHLTLDELRDRADAERDKRMFLRLRVVYLAATGLTAPEVHAALIWDGAGFHVAKALEVPANVSLIRLPRTRPS